MSTPFNYKWHLSDLKNVVPNNKTVFSCFAGGGGSSMGYKLAGFNVLGCNEIDKRMIATYRANLNPKFSFEEPIQEFKNRTDLPNELYQLDILDGSPPCSSFSVAGNREKDWGKKKKFREGQAEQVLDTLFFDFIDLAAKLQPKVVIAENVKGLLTGEASAYLWKVVHALGEAGYYVGHKLLNSATMGIPQKRERVFIYGVRKDLYSGLFADLFSTEPILDLNFTEKIIPYKDIRIPTMGPKLRPGAVNLWHKAKPGENFSVVHPENQCFGECKLHPDRPLPTIIPRNQNYDYEFPRKLFTEELCMGGSFPLDYNFMGQAPDYVIGMSVPPVMVAQVATRVLHTFLV